MSNFFGVWGKKRFISVFIFAFLLFPSQGEAIASLDQKIYPPTTFSNIKLQEGFPATFYQNEVYFFEGDTKTEVEKAFIFLAPEGTNDQKKYLKYSGEVTKKHFKIPVIFSNSGNYRLGVITGITGESKVVNISVLKDLPSLPKTPLSSKLKSGDVQYKNFKTTVTWAKTSRDIIRLTFTQKRQKKIYLFRQNQNVFDIPYKDFALFKSGEVVLTLEKADLGNMAPLSIKSGWSEPIVKPLTVTEHRLTILNEKSITVAAPKEIFKKVESIELSGKTKEPISSDAAIIKPDGFVDIVPLTTNKKEKEMVPKETGFSLLYTPKNKGTYTIELNGEEGESVYTGAFYINNGLPLIPNFFDLYNEEESEKIKDKAKLRAELLKLINKERTKLGLKPVVSNTALQNLAQKHSDDMVKRNFFSHINPDKKNPDDRRKELKIPAPVGENLASAPSLLYSHEGLMQSAVHRKNILNPLWTKVGIGIAFSKEGFLLTTEEFSNDPLTSEERATLEKTIFETLNKTRVQKGMVIFDFDLLLNEVGKQWQENMIEKKFFGFTAPDGNSLEKIVRAKISGRAVQAIILQAGNQEQLTQKILEEKNALSGQWQKIGFSIGVNENGELIATILYS